MLFQRFYNWIKHKTLPPSFLFKNRLFVERNSKNKRIFSNFGLTYRNSKWSSYSNNNIKINFKKYFTFFFSIFFILFIIYILFINFKDHYIFSFFSNGLSFIFWTSLDCLDYYISYSIWIFFAFISLIYKASYCFLVFNNLIEGEKTEEAFRKKLQEKTIFIDKHDVNWSLFAFLKSNYYPKIKKKLSENLFNFSQPNNYWLSSFEFFYNLFKIGLNNHKMYSNRNVFFEQYFLSKDFIDHLNLINSFFKKLYNLVISSFLNFLNNYKKNEKNFIKKEENKLIEKYYLFNYELFNFNLFYFEKQNIFKNYLFKNKNGLFFFPLLSSSNLNNLLINNDEFKNLYNNILNNYNQIKIDRWLYRYFLINQKIIKNSHKISLQKKLIDFSFFSSNDFFKNLWNSSYLSNYLNLDNNYLNFFIKYNYFNINLNLNNFYLFNNFSNEIFSKNKFINNLFFLNVYENSYFWTIKRFFNFVSLNSNKYSLFFNKFKIKDKNNSQISLNFYLDNLNFMNKNLNFYFPYNIFNKNKNINFLEKKYYNFFNYDFFFIYNETFFFNKNSSYIINKIINNSLTSNKSFFYFSFFSKNNYLSNNKFLNKNIQFYNDKNLKKKNNFFFFFNYFEK